MSPGMPSAETLLDRELDVVLTEVDACQTMLDHIRSYIADRLEGIEPEAESSEPSEKASRDGSSKEEEHEANKAEIYSDWTLERLEAREAVVLKHMDALLKEGKSVERRAEELELQSGERDGVRSIVC